MGKYFNLNQVFPQIEDVIETLCMKDRVATHGDIINSLMSHPKGSILVEEACKRNLDQAKEWLAGNMVDWLSAHYERNYRRDFKERFDRIKRDGCWAYFVRKRDK